MDAQQLIKETQEVLKIGELRKKIKDNNFLFYPKINLYREIRQLDKNKLSVCNQGGGFVKSVDITNEDFLKDIDDGIITFVKNIPLEYSKVKVCHDHWYTQYINAYTTVQRWNGWAMPMVNLSNIKRFNTIQKHNDCKEPTDLFKIISEDKISIIDFNDREETIIESQTIIVNGKTKKVFDLSLGWTWSEY